jgi:hypothetical protein
MKVSLGKRWEKFKLWAPREEIIAVIEAGGANSSPTRSTQWSMAAAPAAKVC